MLVKAKNENMAAGLAQCMAEMVAAQRFNASEGSEITRVSGEETEVPVDQRDYYIDRVGKILALLRYLVA